MPPSSIYNLISREKKFTNHSLFYQKHKKKFNHCISNIKGQTLKNYKLTQLILTTNNCFKCLISAQIHATYLSFQCVYLILHNLLCENFLLLLGFTFQNFFLIIYLMITQFILILFLPVYPNTYTQQNNFKIKKESQGWSDFSTSNQFRFQFTIKNTKKILVLNAIQQYVVTKTLYGCYYKYCSTYCIPIKINVKKSHLQYTVIQFYKMQFMYLQNYLDYYYYITRNNVVILFWVIS
eukprot:TRINITY_DN2386_c0_g1_i13.p2 TRINITY_DN2386_c0_g1~~TRINITY_DN2386_c0_g1_i13.p2  ORF type:complete len:237 (+),score=-25.22 TRINITY_DN2386_c0_g1_i13:1798-2508(+)